MSRKISVLFLIISSILLNVNAQELKLLDSKDAVSGASRMALYIPCLQDKAVGVVGNQTSIMDNGTHLLDTLLSCGVNIVKIFTPEHGFRGTADEGASIDSGKDDKTGISIVSLYGKNKKPTSEQLQGIDILVFDLQDVGCRFYTYISTMTYVMEAAAENGVSVIVLDRPNPNGFYVDGPVLDPQNTSFVGMHCVPIVYGLTIGEYALMVNGEKWMKDSLQCDLTVIPLGNYDRNAIYKLPVKPSPNLPNWEAVYLYPSLCFFEGTIVSVGRGTDKPFQIFGQFRQRRLLLFNVFRKLIQLYAVWRRAETVFDLLLLHICFLIRQQCHRFAHVVPPYRLRNGAQPECVKSYFTSLFAFCKREINGFSTGNSVS